MSVGESPCGALLLVSFGGPEGPEEVWPFLERVVAGRGVPRERLAEAARHYDAFGGVSPINARNRALAAALGERLAPAPFGMSLYWGNRFSSPTIAEALAAMRRDAVQRALAFVTSPFDSPAGFTRYLEEIERARLDVGAGAPVVEALPPFWDHPMFLSAQADLVRASLARAGDARTRVVFSAHSIPLTMARACRYEADLADASARIARECGLADWVLAYQSRSGSPGQPWLGPDLRSTLEAAQAEGVATIVACPLGFVTDHMEVCFDLDVEARSEAEKLGMAFVRCPTADRHPAFLEMVAALVAARLGLPSAAVARRPAGARPRSC